MRIAVTGAAGFIGSIFCCRAVEEGHEVIAIDDGSRGLNPVQNLPLTHIEHDCRRGLPDVYGLDAVVHLAAGTGSLSRPIEELRALNVGMTRVVFEDAVVSGAGVFVYPTTSLALGVPDSPYVISKEEGLRWLLSHERSPIVLPLRFFNVIGAYKGFTERRQHEVHILPTLVECHRTGRPFVINGDDYETADGTPGRDYVNACDVVDYVLYLIRRKLDGVEPLPATDGAVWVGTGWVTTTWEVIQTFRQHVGDVKIEYGPRRAFDVGQLQCDGSQAMQMAYFRPQAPPWVGIRDEALALLGGEMDARR